MRTVAALPFLVIIMLFNNAGAASGIMVGAGFDYVPIAKLGYAHNPSADYEIVDNFLWEPRALYNFGNGFRGGALFELYRKTIFPGGSSRSELSLWGIGLLGDYGYEITESGHTLLVGGMETGYGELTDKSNWNSRTAGSVWVAALVGARYFASRNLVFELDYRIGWLEFDMGGAPEKKYTYSGSSLRLSMGYEFNIHTEKKGE